MSSAAVSCKQKKLQVGSKARVFRAYLAALQLLKDLNATHSNRKVRMLDIGGGHGIHARFFRSHGIDVDIVDMACGDEKPIFIGDYLDYEPEHAYDVIWASHVLEHVRNVGDFIDKMYKDSVVDGYVAVSVPPIRTRRMAYNHLSFWNPGMLLLNFGMAGFDMQMAKLAQYGYNISIIAKKNLSSVSDDVRLTFPVEMKLTNKHFDGECKFFNWSIKRLDNDTKIDGTIFQSRDDAIKSLISDPLRRKFCDIEDNEKKKLCYLDEDKLVIVQ